MTPECVRQDNVYQTDFQFARFAEHCASDGVDCFCCSLGRTDLIEVLYTIFTAVASSCTSKILRFLDLICNKTLLQPVSDACIGLWDSANCGLTLRCAVSNGVLESGRNLNDRDGGITLTFHGGGHSGSLTDKANVTNDTNIDLDLDLQQVRVGGLHPVGVGDLHAVAAPGIPEDGGDLALGQRGDDRGAGGRGAERAAARAGV